MQMIALAAAPRAEDSAKTLRKGGIVPCVVYGNSEHMQIQCQENALLKAYATAGESTLVELELEGKKIPVLFHELSFHPVSDRMTHVDFYAVNMKKEIEADIPLRFTGESNAVKELSAILVTPTDTVSVRCLPSNLPHDLEVDLAELVEFGNTITVASIKAPEGVTIITDPETVIAIAQQPREEEKEEPKPAEGEAVAGAEGATPAATEGEKPEGGKDGGGKKE